MFDTKTKLKISLVALVILVLVGACFVIWGKWDIGLWGLWFAAFDAIVVQYAITNVAQSNVISQNYHPELVGKKDSAQGIPS